MEGGKSMKLSIPEEEIMGHGHLACQGCGAALAMRYVLKVLGRNTALSVPACCWSVIDGPFPHSTVNIPLFHTAFETAASTASGIKAAFEILGKDVNVVAWAGDGGTYDIGIQALSGAAERNEDIIYVCYDNEAYMNTGVQRSGSTPYLAWTTTTPVKHPKDRPKKDLVSIMAAHRIPYLATASVAFPEDLIAKIKKAKDIKGTKFILIFSPCPPGWRSSPENTIKLARLAVLTKIFPLIEVEDGRIWKLTKKIGKPKQVGEYLKLQGRFRHLTEDDVSKIQANVDRDWEILMNKIEVEE